jgi:aldehyde dehydrogenase (NAD+)
MSTASLSPIQASSMAINNLPVRLGNSRNRFQTGTTKTYAWRREKLLQLKELIIKHENDIYEALQKDLHKSKEEAYATEAGILLSEINHALKHLKRWMRPEKVATNLVNLPSSSFIYTEPLGVVLIIGPWNYPLMLVLGPCIGAIAAGNTIVLKPSEYAPATAHLINKMISSTFDPSEIMVVEGDGAIVVPEMMQQFRFDHVFFTGGTTVGKKIYEMAATKLVPVTLELGGKSPCIVESDANIKVAARRIAMTKFSNAGQMCIAPDYILVHASVKEKFVEEMKGMIIKFFSSQPEKSKDYGRIINERQFNRLANYLKQGHILFGGEINAEEKYIAPTLMEGIRPDASIMQEEIFGPILPVFSFNSMAEALAIIAINPNPLSFYVYTGNSVKEEEWLNTVSFGGGCVNNSSWHFTNPDLPFGGRGNSGMGVAHGKSSFDCFTHRKAVMKTPVWFDPAIKYPPFKGKLALFKKLIR